jgi:hypothetical protein
LVAEHGTALLVAAMSRFRARNVFRDHAEQKKSLIAVWPAMSDGDRDMVGAPIGGWVTPTCAPTTVAIAQPAPQP